MSAINRLGILFCVMCLALVFVACGDDDDNGTQDMTSNADMTGGDTTQDMTTNPGTGTTECGQFATCQAGQYCEDPILATCTNGCLNNDNCASDQTCVKNAGENVGTCQNNMTNMGASAEEVCSKLMACEPTTTQAMCDQFYAGTNATCHDCVANENCPALNFDNACATECGF